MTSKFNYDRLWWGQLSPDEKQFWLNRAANCGATGEPILCDRDPDFPVICTPSVSIGGGDISDPQDNISTVD